MKKLQRPTISKLHHVALHVNDLASARSFYEHTLGFPVSDAVDESLLEKGIVWYDLPDSRQVHLFRTDDPLPLNRAHLALEVEDVAGWRSFLEQAKLEIVEPSVKLYSAERFFVRDPSGNLIEFVRWLD